MRIDKVAMVRARYTTSHSLPSGSMAFLLARNARVKEDLFPENS